MLKNIFKKIFGLNVKNKELADKRELNKDKIEKKVEEIINDNINALMENANDVRVENTNNIRGETVDKVEVNKNKYKEKKDEHEIPMYNINAELDCEFLKSINRNRGCEYKKFISYLGTKSRPNKFVVFYLEELSINKEAAKIVAIKYNEDKPVEVFDATFAVKNSISISISKSINNNLMIMEDVLPKFLNFIGDNVLITNNANENMSAILSLLYRSNIKKPENKVIDVLKLSKQKIRKHDEETDNYFKLDSYKLDNLKLVFKLDKLDLHEPIDICKMCAAIYIKIKNCNKSMYYL